MATPTPASTTHSSTKRLEAAVLSQLADLYRDGHLIEQALADVARHTESERPRVEEQLASTRADIGRLETKLERYFEAFEDGRLSAELCQERIRGHRTRLETLRETRMTEWSAELCECARGGLAAPLPVLVRAHGFQRPQLIPVGRCRHLLEESVELGERLNVAVVDQLGLANLRDERECVVVQESNLVGHVYEIGKSLHLLCRRSSGQPRRVNDNLE